MGIFTRNNTTNPRGVPAHLADPMAVPAHLAEAYENAEPNAGPYMEKAASALALELLKTTTVSPEDRHRIYTDHFPELVERAEHLSRIVAARWAVEMAPLIEQRKAEGINRATCKVCGEPNGQIQNYMNPDLTAGSGLYGQPKMCTQCRATADLLYAQLHATPARQAAVRAALGIPAPGN